MGKLNVLFVVNVDWFFYSHRLNLAKALLDRGATVTVAAGDTGVSRSIESAGLRFIPIPVSRKGMNPFGDLHLFLRLAALYRTLRPDLIHHVSVKPVIFGSLAARAVRQERVVNAISGLGYSFTPGTITSILRVFLRLLYRHALKSPTAVTVFQNPDDRSYFLDNKLICPERTAMVRGSGVNCELFRPGRQKSKTVVLACRMLRDKGVGIFAEAARQLRASHPGARFVLVGDVDPGNRASVSASEIESWVSAGAVEWWGPRNDMPAILAGAGVAVLPSLYREGLPKFLLEAAASALPIVATDIPGCREIVLPEINGILVPPGDAKALASAIGRLLVSPEMCERYGEAGRSLVESEFSEAIVIRSFLEIYNRLLPGDLRLPLSEEIAGNSTGTVPPGA